MVWVCHLIPQERVQPGESHASPLLTGDGAPRPVDPPPKLSRYREHSIEALVATAATTRGREYRRGYRVVSYPENWTRHLYAPACAEVRIFDVRTPAALTVGYVPGAGDEIPGALRNLGVAVETLDAKDVASGDLGRFSAIVTGIRAYNVNQALRANNRRLLEYVEQGGTLIVQYNTPEGRSGAGFAFGPYPTNNPTAGGPSCGDAAEEPAERHLLLERHTRQTRRPGHPPHGTDNRDDTGDDREIHADLIGVDERLGEPVAPDAEFGRCRVPERERERGLAQRERDRTARDAAHVPEGLEAPDLGGGAAGTEQRNGGLQEYPR